MPPATPSLRSASPSLANRLVCALALIDLLRGKHEGLNRGNADPTAAG